MLSLIASSDSARQIVRSAGLVIAVTILSRITGFGREWMVARLLGSNALTDTYYAAFTLPNLITYLVAGGSIGIILIPVFTKYAAEGQEEESWRVFSIVTTVMALVLFTFLMLGEIFANTFARCIAPGFGPDQHALLVTLIRILLPSQFFLCLGGVLSAVHNAKGRFLVPTFAPIIYNFTLVLCAWFLHRRYGISSFAIGVTVGTLMGFFGLPFITARSIGTRFKPSLAIQHPGVRRFFKLAVPVMLAVSIDVVDVWIVRWFGSYLSAGSITWLMYSRYISMVPIAIIGQGVGIASYPFLAQLFAERKHGEFVGSIAAGAKSLLLIMVPLSALTVVLSKPLVRLAFVSTKLTQPDIQGIAAGLGVLAVGFVAKGLQPLVGRGFAAAHNTFTPALIGSLVTFLTLPLYWFCARTWNYLGLAAASSIVAVVFVVSLTVTFFRQNDLRHLKSVWVCFVKLSLACGIGGLLCRGMIRSLEPSITWQTISGASLILVLGTVVGFPLMLLTARMLGVREVDQYWKKLCLSMPRIPALARS